jgi:hypothetical protein
VEGQAEAARAWRNDEHGAARSSNFKFSRTEWSGLFCGGNSGGEKR